MDVEAENGGVREWAKIEERLRGGGDTQGEGREFVGCFFGWKEHEMKSRRPTLDFL